MSTQPSETELTEKPLVRGSWSCESVEGTLPAILSRIEPRTNATWCGIVWSSLGAVSVLADKGELRACNGDRIDLGTVFEARLWASFTTRTEDEERVLRARELRWLNGSGGVDVCAYSDPSMGEPCWFRAGEYLQHSSSGSEKGAVMSTVEIFCEEPTFSNVVFVDEVMTGKWA